MDGLLERLKERFVSNYFDAITKEFVMKQFNAEWTREFNELVRTRHFVETTETNRRMKEIIAREQTDEKFKQVIWRNTCFMRYFGSKLRYNNNNNNV